MQYTRGGAVGTSRTNCDLLPTTHPVRVSIPARLSRLVARRLQQMEVKQVHFPSMLSGIFVASSLETRGGVIFTARSVSAEDLPDVTL